MPLRLHSFASFSAFIVLLFPALAKKFGKENCYDFLQPFLLFNKIINEIQPT
jgi:hypothetical protein